jgi:hypothetical protein
MARVFSPDMSTVREAAFRGLPAGVAIGSAHLGIEARAGAEEKPRLGEKGGASQSDRERMASSHRHIDGKLLKIA